MIDSHCHLDDPRVEFEVAVRAARAQGVEGAIVPAFGAERWPRQSELLASDDSFRLWGAFGIHPWSLDPSVPTEVYLRSLEQGFSEHAKRWGKKLVAWGEFGLDRARCKEPQTTALQEILFRRQLELACQARLPVILHLVRADGWALRILSEYPNLPGGVIHGFSSHSQTIPAYCKLGLSLGFGAALLTSAKVQEALRAVPEDRYMFETDDPTRGHSLEEIVQAASQVLGKSVEYVRKRHSQTCARVFLL